MRRILVCLLLSAVALLAFVPLGLADNKNLTTVATTCSNGQTYNVVINDQSNINAAVRSVEVGPAKLISFTALAPGTSTVLATFETNYPKEPSVTCTGSTTLIDPTTGQSIPVDFVVEVYAKRA